MLLNHNWFSWRVCKYDEYFEAKPSITTMPIIIMMTLTKPGSPFVDCFLCDRLSNFCESLSSLFLPFWLAAVGDDLLLGAFLFLLRGWPVVWDMLLSPTKTNCLYILIHSNILSTKDNYSSGISLKPIHVVTVKWSPRKRNTRWYRDTQNKLKDWTGKFASTMTYLINFGDTLFGLKTSI